MSLVDYAKKKALDFSEATYKQANVDANTSIGSAIRSLFLIPFAMINAALIQDIESTKRRRLSNAALMGEVEFEDLLTNIIREVPQGASAVATVRVYVSTIQTFSIDTFPYFATSDGTEFRPTAPMSFSLSDFVDDNGEIYVSIPVVANEPGEIGNVDVGDINTMVSTFPVPVSKVTNLSAGRDGSDRMSNQDVFNFVISTPSDGTITQPGGARRFLGENYPEAESLVLSAGDRMIKRDEVWTVDGVYPNLDRAGSPWAAHTNIGLVNPNINYGSLHVSAGGMTQAMVGKRIAVAGDPEIFRKILAVPNPNTLITSGPVFELSAQALIWNDGPRSLVASDIYLYFPTLEVRSTVIDKRQFLVANGNYAGVISKIYVKDAPGSVNPVLYQSGVLTISEGESSQVKVRINSAGSDAGGNFLLFAATSLTVLNGAQLSYYNMGSISVGDDITSTPVLYVLQVDRLDPLSLDAVESIPNSQPGNFEQPGWYIEGTDPAEVFSPREKKKIVIDEKSTLNAYKSMNVGPCHVGNSEQFFSNGSTSSVGLNRINFTHDWSSTEGKEVTVNVSNYEIVTGPLLVGLLVSAGASTNTLTLSGLNSAFLSDVGYRDDVFTQVFDVSSVLIGTYFPGQLRVYENKMMLVSGVFPAGSHNVAIRYGAEYATLPPGYSVTTHTLAWVGGILHYYSGAAWTVFTPPFVARQPKIFENSYEDIIKSTNGTSYIELFEKTIGVRNSGGWVNTANIRIFADQVAQDWNSSPIRVVYATRSSFLDIQSTFDSSSIRPLCGDTLVRSFYPTILDTSITYRGASTPQALFDRFLELLQTSIRDRRSDIDDVRVDLSNIIAALDEEGLADSIDVNFEVKTTNYLDDGEYVVRYLNPSEATKQVLAINADIASSSNLSTITLARLKSQADIPGRGKLFLGGNNPAAQEVVPYEGVIENANNTYTFIVRSGYVVKYEHDKWESATVSVRDYDPNLEYDGAIIIPKSNRPYVRNMVIIRESLV
jgi:hypothetical protein